MRRLISNIFSGSWWLVFWPELAGGRSPAIAIVDVCGFCCALQTRMSGQLDLGPLAC